MVTIGQSPRTDVLLDIRDILGSDIEVIECGALDKLSMDEIAQLKPSKKENLLVSRMRDGSEVRLSHHKIIDRMQECLDRLQKDSDMQVLLCTGEFPELYSKKLLIKPSNLRKFSGLRFQSGAVLALPPHSIKPSRRGKQ